MASSWEPFAGSSLPSASLHDWCSSRSNCKQRWQQNLSMIPLHKPVYLENEYKFFNAIVCGQRLQERRTTDITQWWNRSETWPATKENLDITISQHVSQAFIFTQFSHPLSFEQTAVGVHQTAVGVHQNRWEKCNETSWCALRAAWDLG